MNATPKARLDAMISSLKNRLARLETLRAALDDAEIAEDIAGLFSDEPRNTRTINVVPGAPRGKIFRKVSAFFNSRNNAPATVREIVAATRVSINSLRQVLYKSAVGEFERHGQPGGKRETTFWLKNPKSPQHSETMANERTQ